MMTLLAVALGGAVGAAVRFVASRAFNRRLHWGTLAVNVVGSFVLGLLAGHEAEGMSMALWGVGFCGGMTTYSSFAVQSVQVEPRRAAAYIVLTVLGTLAAAALGLKLA